MELIELQFQRVIGSELFNRFSNLKPQKREPQTNPKLADGTKGLFS